MPEKLLQTRREFCTHACHAASLLTLAGLAPACSNSMSPSDNVPALAVLNANVSGGAFVVSIDAASPLASVGGAALAQTGAGNFLLARTGQDTFKALTAVCTHEGCTVTGFSNQQFVCPCHGSEFNTSGSATRGPASSPLRAFPTQFVNDLLTVTVTS